MRAVEGGLLHYRTQLVNADRGIPAAAEGGGTVPAEVKVASCRLRPCARTGKLLPDPFRSVHCMSQNICQWWHDLTRLASDLRTSSPGMDSQLDHLQYTS